MKTLFNLRKHVKKHPTSVCSKATMVFLVFLSFTESGSNRTTGPARVGRKPILVESLILSRGFPCEAVTAHMNINKTTATTVSRTRLPPPFWEDKPSRHD